MHGDPTVKGREGTVLGGIGDEFVQGAGKDKGKTGKIIRVGRSTDRVYVEGVNIVKRHTRPNPARPMRRSA